VSTHQGSVVQEGNELAILEEGTSRQWTYRDTEVVGSGGGSAAGTIKEVGCAYILSLVIRGA